MTDTVGKQKRSEIMRAIRPSGNKSTELLTMKILRANGIRGWRRHSKIHGRPDFVWADSNVALFVDGCFWHGCKKCYRRPKSNRRFWDEKVKNNQRRDKKVGRLLNSVGWKVIRIHECELKNRPSHCAEKIKTGLRLKP